MSRSDWESKIRREAKELSVKLRVINPSSIDISEYNQRYLKDKLENLESELAKDAHIMKNVLRDCEKPAADIVFLDYGGGTGFLSLLAKQLGIGTVIYNDIYDVSCRDAQGIAESAGCRADHYIEVVMTCPRKWCHLQG